MEDLNQSDHEINIHDISSHNKVHIVQICLWLNIGQNVFCVDGRCEQTPLLRQTETLKLGCFCIWPEFLPIWWILHLDLMLHCSWQDILM